MELSELQELRRQKAAALREAGIDPYPTRAHRTHTTDAARDRFAQIEPGLERRGTTRSRSPSLVGSSAGGTWEKRLRPHPGRRRRAATLCPARRRRRRGVRAIPEALRPRRLRRRRPAHLFRTRTGEISLRVARGCDPLQSAQCAAREVARTAGHRDSLPAALRRPDRQCRGAPHFRDADADRHARFATFSTATATSRSKRRPCSRSTAARRRGRSRPTTTRSIRPFICGSPTSSTSSG